MPEIIIRETATDYLVEICPEDFCPGQVRAHGAHFGPLSWSKPGLDEQGTPDPDAMSLDQIQFEAWALYKSSLARARAPRTIRRETIVDVGA